MLKQIEKPLSARERKHIAAKENSSTSVIIYEVPPGKTFDGVACVSGTYSQVSVNGVTVAYGTGYTPIKLVTGAVVSASYGGGIVGIEE